MRSYERMLALAKDAGQSVSAVRYVMEMIGAHPDLIDFPRVSTGLVKILAASDVEPRINFDGCDKSAVLNACKWISSLGSQGDIVDLFGRFFWLGNSAPDRNPVLNHGVKKFGFPYAIIWHSPSDSENEQDYYRLLAQLLSVFNCRGTHDLQSQRYAVFLDIRRLCELKSIEIPSFLKVWCSSDEFIGACRNFKSYEGDTDTENNLRSVCRLVSYFCGGEPKIRSGGGGHHRPRRKNMAAQLSHFVAENPLGFPLADPDDPDQLPGIYNVLAQPTSSLEGELAPEELPSQTEIWLLNDEGGCTRPYVADLLSQQAIEAHIVRSRQIIPFVYNQFTLSELRDLLFGVSDLFHACRGDMGAAADFAERRLRMESLLMTHICLWLGQSADRVVELMVADGLTDSYDGLIFIPGAPAQFSVIIQRPDLAGDERWQASSGVRGAALRILLPDLAGSSAMILALLLGASGRVFTFSADELEREMRSVLRVLGDRRFTLTKLRSYLFHQILDDTDDVATASMLSGFAVPSAQTPRYYLQLNASYLRRIYVASLERVLQHVYACAGLAYEPQKQVQTQQQEGVGATHCLLPETVKNNANAMAEVLRKKPAGRLSDLLIWHNCYTLWTVQIFMLATGCRAIRNPLQRLDEFDADLGVGALSDKDADDRHMSRLIWIPPMLRRQLEHYLRHCAAISAQLTGYMSKADNSGRWSRGFFLRTTQNGWRRDEISPSQIYSQARQVPGYTPHRVNGYRKFLRTELTERGCPAEPLAAFMGHWLRGEEPQDSYSSFCPAAYVRTIDTWVTPLLTELGWSAISSPWVSK